MIRQTREFDYSNQCLTDYRQQLFWPFSRFHLSWGMSSPCAQFLRGHWGTRPSQCMDVVNLTPSQKKVTHRYRSLGGVEAAFIVTSVAVYHKINKRRYSSCLCVCVFNWQKLHIFNKKSAQHFPFMSCILIFCWRHCYILFRNETGYCSYRRKWTLFVPLGSLTLFPSPPYSQWGKSARANRLWADQSV